VTTTEGDRRLLARNHASPLHPPRLALADVGGGMCVLTNHSQTRHNHRCPARGPINRRGRRCRVANPEPLSGIMDPLILVFVVPTAIVAWAAYNQCFATVNAWQKSSASDQGAAKQVLTNEP